jgi:hypothetical protein
MSWDASARPWDTPRATPPGPPPKPPPPNIPNPPPITGAPLTVDDAWELFGVVKTRGTKIHVKRRYLAFVSIHHPDKHPDDEVGATAQLARANAAYTLLKKYCKWK